ncbi:MAG: carbon-nitrogen hydrolase [Acidobacteriota bacterium]|nr:carbon-nitrogen hydrolase [Acidobacteriota bacterium]
MTTQLTVGLAQLDSRLGQIEVNLGCHLEWIERAREKGVELLIFPELSLTGYRLLHLTGRVALRRNAPQIERLVQAAGRMSIIVGIVEEDDKGVLYNSSLLIHGGQVNHVHRKLYLPTYGIFQEGRFFGPGDTLELAQTDNRHLGMLICEDLWHPHLARSLAIAGAKMLTVLSAGPGRVGSGNVPESHRDWESLTRSTALVNTCWVLYCNRVGWEEGSFYTGGSHIVRPGGEVMARAPYLDEHLLVAEIDLREVDRLRWRLPLVRAVRTDIKGAR